MMEATYKDLMESLKLHDYSTSKQLLELGADPNCISKEDGVSAFHLAVGLDSQTSLKLVELCIQYGGNPNVRSHEGMTPVMVAASWGRFQALQILLVNGGDPELRDEDNKDALDHAIDGGSWDCKQLLQQHMNLICEHEDDEDDQRLYSEPSYSYERYYSASSNINSPCSESRLDDSTESEGAFHGFDVTSPDHPFAFVKSNPLPTQLNKTAIIHHDRSHHETFNKSMNFDASLETLEVSFLDKNNEQTISIHDSTSPLEFIYHDEERGISLIERRCYLNNNSANESAISEDSDTFDPLDETVLYNWQDALKEPPSKSKHDLDNLTSEQLTLELTSYGYNPGPITSTTKDIYKNKLAKLRKEKRKTKDANSSKVADYSQELSDFMQKCSISTGEEDEGLMCATFQNPDPQRKWREGTIKSSFNYLLLDPRVTRNLPHRSKGLDDSEIFKIFLAAVFYIGKGKRGRPYAHFYEGLEQIRNPRMKPSDKVQHIVDIWESGLGVVSLHVFQGVIPVEAYTREACMVDSLSLARLTNARRGDYYGVASTWTSERRKQLGSHLLHKCMQIFLIEGERQIRPIDLHGGNK
ncbi:ankyrin repeat and LEM domain-containing protein 1-like isoform X2 [Anneissia japonica]|uniref:ankyrin repeat and LEM domain-containing protein 1-like isoform X2 n=1 Tax=Anneissia japonica TaxID=1529436 RepID=UPI00142568F0|nr:ankyrin repeat and LEM domain-containing protein 1-like isoform X2 [Anneissia japonica]